MTTVPSFATSCEEFSKRAPRLSRPAVNDELEGTSLLGGPTIHCSGRAASGPPLNGNVRALMSPADRLRWLMAPDRGRWKPMLIGLAVFAAGVGAASALQP